MKAVVLYREHSEQYRPVHEFITMLERRYPGRSIQRLDIDTRDGAAEASLYGVAQYPAIIVKSIDGQVIQKWEGEHLPMVDEVAVHLLHEPAMV